MGTRADDDDAAAGAIDEDFIAEALKPAANDIGCDASKVVAMRDTAVDAVFGLAGAAGELVPAAGGFHGDVGEFKARRVIQEAFEELDLAAGVDGDAACIALGEELAGALELELLAEVDAADDVGETRPVVDAETEGLLEIPELATVDVRCDAKEADANLGVVLVDGNMYGKVDDTDDWDDAASSRLSFLGRVSRAVI